MNRRLLRWTLSILLGTSILLCVSLPLQAHWQTPDANKLVQEMIATYKNADTYQESSEAILRFGSEIVQTSQLIYKKPNQFQLVSRDPIAGTLSAYSDGKNVALYTAKTNLYTRRSAGENLAKTLTIANKASEASFGISSSQALSPLSFLTAKAMPNEAKNFRYVRAETVNGTQTHCVAAPAELAWARQLINDPKAQFSRREIKLWIDAQTRLLVKGSLALQWKAQVVVNDKKQATTNLLELTEVHRDMRLNAAVKASDFRFVPPKNAKQVFQEVQEK